LADHPEVSVRIAENVLFYSYTTVALTLNIIVVMLAIPHLITRDLSSRALVIYASRAVTRWDYLLGKLGTLLALLGLTWVAPVCLGWFLGNLLAPEWHFFWHGRVALMHALVFTIGAVFFLSLLGLAVSAVSAKEKSAVGVWLILWLVGNTLVPIAQNTSSWLQFLSFRHDLRQVAIRVYQPAKDLERAQQEIPVFGEVLRQAVRQRPDTWSRPRVGPALVALGCLGLGAIIVLRVRTRTE
jgi:ABC-type transport system involved in multi-copper enzyme maturation permease subunit